MSEETSLDEFRALFESQATGTLTLPEGVVVIEWCEPEEGPAPKEDS